MRHDIRHEVANLPVLIKKPVLFGAIYNQVDAEFNGKLGDKRIEEIWRQTRKVCGEYVGNLYEHDNQVTFTDVEVRWDGATKLIVSISHDGKQWNQFSGAVKPLSAGLVALGAVPTIFLGTSQAYDGFKLEIDV